MLKENAQAMIAADRGVPHGEVVKLIDLVRVNGLTSFAINIDPDDDPIVDEDAADLDRDSAEGVTTESESKKAVGGIEQLACA